MFSAFSAAATALHLVNCFPEAFGRPRVFSLKRYHGPELVLYDMRYISPVNRCGTTHLGSRPALLLVFLACLLLFLVHFQGIAMMRTLKGGICQCIKYVERHLRVKCNYTDTESGKTCLRSCSGSKESEGLHNFLFFLTEWKKVQCHYFCAHEFLMQLYSCFVCFVYAICKHLVLFMACCK